MFKHLPGSIKKIEKRYYFFIIILLLAIFLRFWNIPNTVQFLGDQGRDALIVSKIFREKDLVFIGPVTSVGNMYLGPLYYYFMIPFLMITYPSPMGPVYTVAFLGVLTVFLMYILGKTFLTDRVAIIGASLFGLSAIVAENTRFSWNPNLAPLVSLLMIYFVTLALKKSVKYWILVFVCFAVLIQLHYLTLLSAAGFGLMWIYQLYKKYKSKQPLKTMLLSTFIGVLIFFVSLTPLLLFDLKHDGLNRKAFLNILTKEQTFVQKGVQGSNSATKLLLDMKHGTELILTRISIGKLDYHVNSIMSSIIFGVLIYTLIAKMKKKQDFVGELIIVCFLVTGIFGIAVYKHNIFNHYIAYLFPVLFFATAIALDFLWRKNFFGKLFVLLFLVFFIRFNITYAQKVLKSTGWTIARTQSVAKTIEDRVSVGEKYNIVLLTGTGDIEGQNYRYFLTSSEKPPVNADQNDEIDTLFIINDDRVLKKVTDSPIYEIVVFPNKIPSEVYEIEDGPEITVLRRN